MATGATMSEIVLDDEFLTLSTNPALFSNLVIAEGGDVSEIVEDAFSGSGQSVCPIWTETGVGECEGAVGVSVRM